MPLSDWQFWIVTVTMAAALWWVIRPLLPVRRSSPRRASLTIEGRDIKRS